MDAEQYQCLTALVESLRVEQVRTNTLLVAAEAHNVLKKETTLLTEYVIEAGSDYDVPSISNPGFQRARVMMSVGYDAAATGNVTVDLYYNSHKFGEIIELKTNQKQGASGASEVIDIQGLGGFVLKIVNHDVNKSVTTKNMKILMFNEG